MTTPLLVGVQPTEPISLTVVSGTPGQLALSTGGSAGTVSSVLGQIGAVTRIAYPATTLTDAATVSVNAALGNRFTVTLNVAGATRQLGAPTNPADGQPLIVEVIQDATGGRLLTYNAAYEFGSGLPAPTLSAGANQVDLLGFIYSAAAGKWRFVAFAGGFAS